MKTMKVPGATLYYEVRGSGPTLLMIPGGPADADAFAAIAPMLAGRYTVVTFDPRGNSRSALDGPMTDWNPDVHADDASRLVAAVGPEPAYVFGSSSGALVALAFAARHPGQVRALVAHEPPLTALLADSDRYRAINDGIYELYRREGAGPAMATFLAHAGLEPGPRRAATSAAPASPGMAAVMARMAANVELFLAHTLRAVGDWVPDLGKLRGNPIPIVVAGGEASRGGVAYRSATALAERLGAHLTEFPGDHGGFATEPGAFAERLDEVLRAAEAALAER